MLVNSQKLPVKNYTVNDGLTSNRVRSILKDSKDRLWIGTASGLMLYDGQKFTTVTDLGSGAKNYNLSRIVDNSQLPNNIAFNLQKGDYYPQYYEELKREIIQIRFYKSVDRGGFIGQAGITSQNIFSLTEDNEGNIWIGTFTGGIIKYDGTNFTSYTTKDGLIGNDVRTVWFSKKFNLLFIGTTVGCSVFDGKKFLSLYLYHHRQISHPVMAFSDGPDYVSIFPFTNLLFKYDPVKEIFITVPHRFNRPSSTNPVILPNNDTIIGWYRAGFHVINKYKWEIHRKIGQIFDLERDNQGNIWIAAWIDIPKEDEPGGLYKFDYKNKKVIRYNEKTGIDDFEVWSLYFDEKQNILWVGTLNKGLFRIELSGIEWFDEMPVFSLANLNDTTIIVGSKNKLYAVDNHDNIQVLYNTSDVIVDDKTFRKKINEFLSVQVDNKENIYACGYQTEVVKLQKKDNYHNAVIGKSTFEYSSYSALTQDSVYSGDSWLSIVKSTSQDNLLSIKPYFFWDYNTGSEIRNAIYKNDTIWYYSLTKGLYRSFHGNLIDLNKQNSKLPLAITTMCFDQVNNLIIGANDGMVYIAHRNADLLTIQYKLVPNIDFIGNTIITLVTDKQNNLYIITNQGLNIVPLTDILQKRKHAFYFLNNNETGMYDVNATTSLCDNMGNVWIGTKSRLYKINTNRLLSFVKSRFAVNISNVIIDYERTVNLSGVKNLRLNHRDDNLLFTFGNNNLYNPSDNLFRYKLNGLMDEWSPYTNSNSAVFNSLAPGKYRLQIQSYNRMNSAGVNSVSLNVEILHPWFKHPLFIIFLIILFFAGVAFAFTSRINYIRKQELKRSEINKRLATIEMRALQSQMNPHFVFNCINSIQGLILNNRIDEALAYLLDFSRILRKTLDNASRETISLSEEIQYIRYYLNLEMMRFDMKLDFEMETHPEIDSMSVKIPPMILQPHIENALNHGLRRLTNRKATLRIKILPKENKYLIAIEDNGVGRMEAQKLQSNYSGSKHKSRGTQITLERFDLLNKANNTNDFGIEIIDLYDSEGVPCGTRIEITIPKQEENNLSVKSSSTSIVNTL